mmetsp:Transcript_1485/g.5097  ORF Transcript_1485/g.5097 Transcript_1485/m.5097 type:complete len:458 (-) Transcript_1485:107-1480(-)
MLEFGVGTISWEGDPWLTLFGVGVLSLIVVSYAAELKALPALPVEKPEDEEQPLVEALEQPKKRATSNTTALLSGLAVLCCSVSLVYTNAWIVGRFPYICTYITVQQGFCFVTASVCIKLRVVEPVELSCRTYLTRVAPLGVCFTLYLWGSNSAYKFLEPGLIQMLKPIGSCFVFAHACALGVEDYSRAKALNFLFITTGTLLTAAPEIMNGVGGVDGADSADVVFGVGVLVLAYFCDAYYVVCVQRLSEGQLVSKPLDPLTTLRCISPVTGLCLLAGSLYAEPEAWGKLYSHVGPPSLLLACLLAFGFNLAVMNFIGRLSATTYVIFDYIKDLIILAAAFFLFAEHFRRNELIGYLVVLFGAATWRHRKLRGATGCRHQPRNHHLIAIKSPEDKKRKEDDSSATRRRSMEENNNDDQPPPPVRAVAVDRVGVDRGVERGVELAAVNNGPAPPGTAK